MPVSVPSLVWRKSRRSHAARGTSEPCDLCLSACEVLASSIPVPRGNVVLTYEYANEGVHEGRNTLESLVGGVSSGTGRLFINEQVVGEARLPGAMIVSRAGPGSLGIGQAFGSPVSDTFSLPFKFTGVLSKVEVQLK